MGQTITSIFLGLLILVLGIKIGISFLSDDLLYKNKISTHEHKYFQSWRYIKKLLQNNYDNGL